MEVGVGIFTVLLLLGRSRERSWCCPRCGWDCAMRGGVLHRTAAAEVLRGER